MNEGFQNVQVAWVVPTPGTQPHLLNEWIDRCCLPYDTCAEATKEAKPMAAWPVAYPILLCGGGESGGVGPTNHWVPGVAP